MGEVADLFSLDLIDIDIERSEGIDARTLKSEHKRTYKKAMRKEKAAEILTELPSPGESLHIVSNGKFDYWDFVPLICELLKAPVDQAYLSTWTLNRECCKQTMELLDSGKIQNVGFLTGLYFKQRESSVYATLVNGLHARGQKFRALENHSKIALLRSGETYIVMEGSANFTGNPRIEQNTITQDRQLWEFHAEWFEEILNEKTK